MTDERKLKKIINMHVKYEIWKALNLRREPGESFNSTLEKNLSKEIQKEIKKIRKLK